MGFTLQAPDRHRFLPEILPPEVFMPVVWFQKREHDTGTAVRGAGLQTGTRAWENFLAICRKPAPGILEFCGMGPHVEEVRDDLLCSTVPVSLICLVLPLDTCIARASQRHTSQ